MQNTKKYLWHQNKYGVDAILKLEIAKITRNYKAVERFCLLCMKKELAITTYPISKEVLNQWLKDVESN